MRIFLFDGPSISRFKENEALARRFVIPVKLTRGTCNVADARAFLNINPDCVPKHLTLTRLASMISSVAREIPLCEFEQDSDF